MNTPSIFSRLFETEIAFNRINNIEIDHKSEKIVSEWLDFMEFIYLYGETIEVLHVNIQDLQNLGQGNRELVNLKRIIEEDLELSPLRHEPHITSLISIEGHVIGGTSPMTILYVSPNTKHYFCEREIYYQGTSGNRLFYGDVIPLKDRSVDYQQFMYSYMINHNLPDCIRTYIYNQLHQSNVGHEILDNIHHVNILTNLTVIVDQNNIPVTICGIPLYNTPIENLTANSDYMIQPTKYCDGNLPLVLTHQGINGANYLSGIRWIYGSVPVIDDGLALEERILPLTRYKYPFLTTEDLIEEKLIFLPHGVNDSFMTCGDVESRFLLPIKPLFFKYFRIEDIENIFYFRIVDESHCTAYLRIPVRGGTIELRKEYREEYIVYPNVEYLRQNICVTPFYTINGDDNEEHYIYSTYSNQGDEPHLIFINSVTLEEIPAILERDNSITSYMTGRKWDIMRVTTVESTGLLIPQFKHIYTHNINQVQFSVCIGDDNTTIMHSQEGCIPQSLVFDCQYIYTEALFNSERAIGLLRSYGIFVLKPNEILCTPYATMRICKHAPADLHESKSFGYGIVYDITESNVLEYWDFVIKNNILTYIRQRNRVPYLRMYCDQLVIMMKAMAALRYGSKTFDLDVITPDWLTSSEKMEYARIWREAINSHDINRCNLHFSSKADTIIHQTMAIQGLVAMPCLNIHIDTHHIDITFADYQRENIAICIPFGSEDLFTDSFSFMEESIYENVYSRYLQDYAHGYEYDDKLRLYLNRLFDIHIPIGTIIQTVKKEYTGIDLSRESFHQISKAVFILALSYYVNKAFVKFNLNIPSEILFSGIGVKILSFTGCET